VIKDFTQRLSTVESHFNSFQKQHSFKVVQCETRLDMAFNEMAEIKKDVDIKFGSRNLLSFGGMGTDKDLLKDNNQKLMKDVEEKVHDMLGLIEANKQEALSGLENAF